MNTISLVKIGKLTAKILGAIFWIAICSGLLTEYGDELNFAIISVNQTIWSVIIQILSIPIWMPIIVLIGILFTVVGVIVIPAVFGFCVLMVLAFISLPALWTLDKDFRDVNQWGKIWKSSDKVTLMILYMIFGLFSILVFFASYPQ